MGFSIVKRSLHQPSLLHFNYWLAEKAEAHERMRANAPKNRNQANQANAGPSKRVKKNCPLIGTFLTKTPINSIRPVLLATANMTFGPVPSTKRKLFFKEQSLPRSRIVFFLSAIKSYFSKMPKI